MSVPLIGDVVDLGRFKYVCPWDYIIKTSYGQLLIDKGWLSDGASGVADLDPEAFFFHDRMYHKPIIGLDRRRLMKWQVDVEYGVILRRNSRRKENSFLKSFWQRRAAWIRPIGLLIGGHGAWNNHRRLELSDPIAHATEYRLKDPDNWKLPKDSIKLADAKWIGKDSDGAEIDRG